MTPGETGKDLRARFVLVFDGGSLGNPGPAYGSFRLQRRGEPAGQVNRLTFGRGTNNEAEYLALIGGLRGLLETCKQAGWPAREVGVEVRGDSRLVMEQLRGTWKVKSDRLAELWQTARDLLNQFGAVRLVHQDRRRSVHVLGH